MSHQPKPDVSAVVSKVADELSGSQLVKGHQLPCHRDLCQSVACHQDGGGSHKAWPCIPAALVWVGQLLQIESEKNASFTCSKAETLGWV